MLINHQNLSNLYIGFKAAFQGGLGQAATQHEAIAMIATSTTAVEQYGWLGQVPGFREWLGDRVVQNVMAHDYSIRNKDFELTIGVPRNAIEDDQYGVYSPLFTEMGRSTAAHPSELCFALLKNGFAQTCYDGQNFFDTDHPVIQEDGSVASVSNSGGGSGTPWFLMDNSRAVKPIILQNRKPDQFVSKQSLTDDNVFHRKEFLFGVDNRRNVGFGLWQLAYGSKQTLDGAAYAAARAALQEMKGDHGRPLGVMPNLLVVPPSLEGKALEILNAERDAAGATNVWKGTAKVLVSPLLA